MLRAAIVLATLAAACGSDYTLRFECRTPGAAQCPIDRECPTVPLGAGGCEEVPGLFGHEPIQVEAGRVVGCTVFLPYENPNYPGHAQPCDCTTDLGTPRWLCPI